MTQDDYLYILACEQGTSGSALETEYHYRNLIVAIASSEVPTGVPLEWWEEQKSLYQMES